MRIPDPSDWRSILQELRLVPEVVRSDEELAFHWLPSWEQGTGQRIEVAIHQALEELREDIGVAEKTLESGRGDERQGASYAQLARDIGCLRRSSVGSAPKTALLAAYLSQVFGDHPHDGIVEAANLLGSDTDTISTMAGAIVGVTAKTDPPEMVSDTEYLEKEARRLWEISEGVQTTSHPYPDLLYWRPPASQMDALGRQQGKWVLQGLGEAIAIDDPVEKQGKYPVTWQWFKLRFGQTVLVKRRPAVRALAKEVLPIEPRAAESRIKPPTRGRTMPESTLDSRGSEQTQLWDHPKPAEAPDQERVTIELATDRAISSGFRDDVVGSMLMKLAEQEDGIDKSIAFAAIVAKAKQARMKRERKSKS